METGKQGKYKHISLHNVNVTGHKFSLYETKYVLTESRLRENEFKKNSSSL